MPPLKYFWVVSYTNGTALSQFDPDTGEEHQWLEVDESSVCRIAWAEFSHELSKKIKLDTISVRRPKMHYVDFNPDEKILICRRNHITVSSGLVEKGHRIEYLIGKGESGDNENIIVRLE
jgi:hypothetical protein